MTQETPPLALITGGSAGLGRTLAGFLAARGSDLILTGRRKERLQKAAGQLRDFGGQVIPVAGDIADPAHRARLAGIVRDRGQLQLLVNNASTLGPLPMPELASYPLDDLRAVLEINTIAPLALVQSLRGQLAAAGGLIINISSDAALGGYETWGGYGASKAALDLITLTLAHELRQESIGVVSVDPGDMRTQMQQDAFQGEDIGDRPLPEATIPFWAWLLGQDPATLSGRRFQAQSEQWQVLA